MNTHTQEQSGNTDSMQTNGATGDTELLRRFCDAGFNGNLAEAALVLGRETDELQQMLDGEMPVDEDLVMKIQGIAEERGIEI